nr:DMT family transporter [Pantoea sp. S62]
MKLSDWGLLFLLSLLWGGSFFFNGVLVKHLSPLPLVAARVTLAAAVLWGVLLVCHIHVPRSAKVWGSFMIMGLLNNVLPFLLIVWGQSRIASGTAAILNATTPLFTVLLAHRFTSDERLSWRRTAGVLTGFGGVAWMLGHDNITRGQHSLPAELAVLAAALSYAIASLWGRRFNRAGLSPLVPAAGQLTASSLLTLPAVFLTGDARAFLLADLSSWLALAGLAVFSTALAYLIFFGCCRVPAQPTSCS